MAAAFRAAAIAAPPLPITAICGLLSSLMRGIP
jgi:hypothetical protein